MMAGCQTTGSVQQAEVGIKPPVDLMADCPHPAVSYMTNADLAKAILSYQGALELCNIDKRSLREWAEKQ
jgi:hypothetical protein